MRNVRSLIVFLPLLLLGANALQAQSIPEFINYQGKLTNAAGAPLTTGNYTLKFSVYSAASNGALVWGPQIFDGQAGQGHGAQVPVVNGFFNVILGPVDTGGVSILRALSSGPSPSSARYVEITVGTGSPILPRQRFLSVPYAVNGVPAGTVLSFVGTTAPDGFLLCDGSAVSRTTYAQLFSIMGVTFGAGDGSATFNLPDLRGRVPLGFGGAAAGLSNLSLGSKSGKESIGVEDLPPHNHVSSSAVVPGGGTKAGGPVGNLIVSSCNFGSGGCASEYTYEGYFTTNTGGGSATGNLQPSLVVNFIIKY